MLRSIAVKLTLAFLLVGLSGALLVAVILQVRTRTAFDQFILDRDQQALVDNLEFFYQSNGSWTGVAGNLPYITGSAYSTHPDYRRSTQPFGQSEFTLVNIDRTVLLSSAGDRTDQLVSAHSLDSAVPLKANNLTVGYLILGTSPHRFNAASPEAIFLDSINRATLYGALGAAALALFLGSVLAYTQTRSLRELTHATLEIARGKFGRQVKVRSRDEFGELTSSFNKMSTDLARASQLRQQMTADIAHDLRTPLSVISGYAEALSDQKLPGTPEVYGILYEETQHLSRLVEDLRTLSLADSGELSLLRQPTDPQALLQRVALRHSVAAVQKGIHLRVEASPNLPAISIDQERIAQVLDNLVSNAFRYTPSPVSPSNPNNEGEKIGEVSLIAQRGVHCVELVVKDNGRGIAPEDLSLIFDRFFRGDPSRSQNGESGLGLAIAKSIVEAHGGTISAASALGHGAVFTIRLPEA